MLDRVNLVALMKQVAKADPSAPVSYSFNGQNLSYEAMNETLRKELNELAGTYSMFRDNKNLIYSMIVAWGMQSERKTAARMGYRRAGYANP